VISLDDGVPDWARTLATLALGAGGAKVLAVWLENRRLTQREYRETLISRIDELESCVSSLQTRVGNLRVEVAHLEERLVVEEERADRLELENDGLRSRLQDRDDPDPHRGG
jgi:hypothetical protein